MGPLGMLDRKLLHLDYICTIEKFWQIVQCWFGAREQQRGDMDSSACHQQSPEPNVSALSTSTEHRDPAQETLGKQKLFFLALLDWQGVHLLRNKSIKSELLFFSTTAMPKILD